MCIFIDNEYDEIKCTIKDNKKIVKKINERLGDVKIDFKLDIYCHSKYLSWEY